MKTYEEKYKKALEWMREVYPTLQGAAKEDAEYYFPELKESEDEKIRQLLLRFVKYDMSDNYSDDFTPADCIAWLEKQGKNNMGISEATKQELEDSLNKALEKETPEYWNKFLDEQGEQNYKIIKGKNYFCVKTHNYAGLEWIKGTKYYASDNYTLVNQGYECYCSEYNKEEHNNLFEEVKCDGCVEKQNEQKPAWSEEDENRVNRLIAYFEDKESFTAEDDIVYANWLKSLRPQNTWKPSDEQMKILSEVLNFAANHENPHWNDYIFGTLHNLIRQLKKLREE